jgi:hypothetical protein
MQYFFARTSRLASRMCVCELHKRFLSSFGFAAGPKPERLAFAKRLAPQAVQQRADLSVVIGCKSSPRQTPRRYGDVGLAG